MRPIARVALLLALALAAPVAGATAAEAAPSRDRVGPPTAERSWVGRLLAPVTARVAPDRSARARTVLQPIAPLGGSSVSLQVLRAVRRDGRTWVQVRLPIRPNGSRGWVPADVLRLRHTPMSVLIDLSDSRLVVRRAGRPVLAVRVGVGKDATPTPTGRFAVAEMIRTGTPGGFLGPVVFPLTGYSQTLNEYAGGNGRVAIHGTSAPELIPGRVSHGCVRVRNADVVRVAGLVRPGTPVWIRP